MAAIFLIKKHVFQISLEKGLQMSNKGTIKVTGVSKVYDNGVVGLDNINLDIGAGEFVVIVGLSGAGKSTLLRSLNRLHDVTEGSIEIDGQDITKASGKELRNMRRNVAMIFQNYNLVKRATVSRNVLSGRVGYYGTWQSAFGLFTKEDQERAAQSLTRVNLLDKYYTKARDLSGGQQQRVGIARALMQEPAVFLADEPVSGLDPKTTKVVMDDLKRLNEEDGLTVIANLHSIDLALAYATRIVGLRGGKLVYDQPIENVKETDFADIYREAEVSRWIRPCPSGLSTRNGMLSALVFSYWWWFCWWFQLMRPALDKTFPGINSLTCGLKCQSPTGPTCHRWWHLWLKRFKWLWLEPSWEGWQQSQRHFYRLKILSKISLSVAWCVCWWTWFAHYQKCFWQRSLLP